MDGLARVPCESGVVDLEAKLVEIFCDDLGGRLLAVESKREGLDTAEEEEGVKRREAVSNRVDREGDPLGKMTATAKSTHSAPSWRPCSRTLAMSSRLHEITPAMRSWCPERYFVPLS